jgi:uncharacterized membrane protein
MTRWLYLSIALTLATLGGSMYLYAFEYDRLPEQIPAHWNVVGEADRWMAKEDVFGVFLLVPLIMVGLIIATLVLPWLSPKPFEVDPFRSTYAYIMALVVALLGFIHMTILWASLQPGLPLVRILIAGIFLFLALMGNVLGRVRRNFWIGVRTPWTLASEKVWIRTHRVTAWLFVAMGLFGFVAIAAGAPVAWCFMGVMVVALISVVYSLVLYKVLEKQGKLEIGNE